MTGFIAMRLVPQSGIRQRMRPWWNCEEWMIHKRGWTERKVW